MTIVLAIILVLTCLNTVAIGALVLTRIKDLGIKKVVRPSTELADFLDDVKRHGFGVVRLDPDSLMIRGRRG